MTALNASGNCMTLLLISIVYETLCHIQSLGSPLIDGIFLVQKMCIYSCVTLSTTLLITRGPVQRAVSLWCINVYIMYIYFPKIANEILSISKANEILSLSVERENRLKLCQATWTTHSHSEKFNKMLKNFANFTRFSLLFSTKKVTGSLVKLSESILKRLFCVFNRICVVFVLFLRGYECNLGIYLPTLGKYIYMMYIDASQADRALNWTARNQ